MSGSASGKRVRLVSGSHVIRNRAFAWLPVGKTEEYCIADNRIVIQGRYGLVHLPYYSIPLSDRGSDAISYTLTSTFAR